MDIKVIGNILTQNLEEYDRALASIRQCAAAYEKKCEHLIELVANSSSIEIANDHFDSLVAIQSDLSKIVFARNIEIGARLSELVKEFDRLYDPHIWEYWFDRFRAGLRWPS